MKNIKNKKGEMGLDAIFVIIFSIIIFIGFAIPATIKIISTMSESLPKNILYTIPVIFGISILAVIGAMLTNSRF